MISLSEKNAHTLFAILQEFVPVFLEGLSDDELKKEAKNETKNDALSSVIKVSFQEQTSFYCNILRIRY